MEASRPAQQESWHKALCVCMQNHTWQACNRFRECLPEIPDGRAELPGHLGWHSHHWDPWQHEWLVSHSVGGALGVGGRASTVHATYREQSSSGYVARPPTQGGGHDLSSYVCQGTKH